MNKLINFKSIFLLITLVILGIVITSCSSTSKLIVNPVSNFNLQMYLGRWYEIARFDFKWEKNMSNVVTNYSMNDDGSVMVVNSGYDFKAKKNKRSVGKAKFVGKGDVGALKVSFFGPFYSAYNVIAVDPSYQYALVAGGNKRLMWILSRTPTIPENVKEEFLSIAKSSGYDTEKLVWTVQN